jgi:hypothetical protein
MSNEEIVHFWGEDLLVRWPRNLVIEMNLPEGAKRFLAEVGLPREVDWTMRFELTPQELQRSEHDPRQLVIGYDDVAAIGLDKQREGCVVSTGPDGKQRFVNSDVHRFGEFLVLYQRYRLAVRNSDDEGAQEVIAKTEQEMRASDPTALSDPECWWAVIVEQMRAGLL